MLFAIIRLAVFCVVFSGGLLLVRRSRSGHKRRWMAAVFATAVILTTITALIPIENGFVSFSSPESAYSYNHSGSAVLVVDGEETAFVVGTKGDTAVYAIVPRSEQGWKMGMGTDIRRIAQTVSEGITIYVYQYKDSNEYYITVLDTNGGPSDISDSRDSEFRHYDTVNGTLNQTFCTYCAFVDSLDEQYVITVNGRDMKIQS